MAVINIQSSLGDKMKYMFQAHHRTENKNEYLSPY